ncbi:MAG TPA: DUF2147 domain-containing protein [Methyloceanibacter sp.]|nr:DUF2147 domain-containing protein [Methyloceanibacter sp.]
MKHRTFAPAIGALAALFLAAGVPSYASAADPSGIWAKDDGSAKMEVRKCGRGICSKIVWLRDPNDSRGRPLHDARNENTSMRDRPIMGLPLFSNMVATDSNAWVGNVYNPEEGKIYTDVKVTLVSRNQIVLKGCKAWLLCGEKVWTRSKLPPTEAAPEPIEVKAPAEPAAEEQKPIEVKATEPSAMDMAPKAPMDMAPKPTIEASKTPMDVAPKAKSEARVMEAAREPMAEPPAPKPIAAPLAVAAPSSEATTVEARVSVAPPKQRLTSPAAHNAVGLGLVAAPVGHPDPLPLTGENVSSMMVMTKPAPVAATPAPEAAQPEVNEASVEAAVDDDPPAPAAKPKPKPRTLSADASESASAAAVPRVVAVKPKPKVVKPKEPEEVLPWLRPRY